MEITEQRITIDSKWFSAEREVQRSKGLHLSHIINHIEDQKKAKDRNFTGELVQNYMSMGFLWERALEHLIENDPYELWEWLFTGVLNDVNNPRVIRPGEQCLDGIYMTPDGYDIESVCLEEYKFTTKSLKNDIRGPKFERWLKYQIPCYLKALRLKHCRLRVLFGRGDYTNGAPIWMEYWLEYSHQEIDDIWEEILRNADYMRENNLVDLEAT